jgi:hypothetical protein
MKDKIKEILLKTLQSNYDEGDINDNGILGGEECITNLEKFIIGLLEEQKRACANAVYNDSDPVILSTPLVVESDLIVLSREKMEEIIIYYQFSKNKKLGEHDKFVLKSKFGINL